MNSSDAEGEDQTFTFFQDPKTGKVFYEGEKIAKAGAAHQADVSQSAAGVRSGSVLRVTAGRRLTLILPASGF